MSMVLSQLSPSVMAMWPETQLETALPQWLAMSCSLGYIMLNSAT